MKDNLDEPDVRFRHCADHEPNGMIRTQVTPITRKRCRPLDKRKPGVTRAANQAAASVPPPCVAPDHLRRLAKGTQESAAHGGHDRQRPVAAR